MQRWAAANVTATIWIQSRWRSKHNNISLNNTRLLTLSKTQHLINTATLHKVWNVALFRPSGPPYYLMINIDSSDLFRPAGILPSKVKVTFSELQVSWCVWSPVDPCMKDDWGHVRILFQFIAYLKNDLVFFSEFGLRTKMYQRFVLSIYPPQNISVGRASSSGGSAPSGLVRNKRTSRFLGESSIHLRCFTFFTFLLFRSSFGSNSTI